VTHLDPRCSAGALVVASAVSVAARGEPVEARDFLTEVVLAAWHPRLGRAVIEAWELPQELANAVGDHQGCRLEAPDPPTMTEVVAVANYLAEQTSTACNDDDFHSKAPNFGSLSMDKPTFDWLIRAGDVDIRLLLLAFGV
jgi:HD-like signal output (HDOD) protein